MRPGAVERWRVLNGSVDGRGYKRFMVVKGQYVVQNVDGLKQLFEVMLKTVKDPDHTGNRMLVGEIDLEPYGREELMLAIPAFAECRVDCRGLCAGCGENLTESECQCLPGGMDPRWDALRALEHK